MDVHRSPRKAAWTRRRRLLLALASLASLAAFWAPAKGVLIDGLVIAGAAGAEALGIEAAAPAPVPTSGAANAIATPPGLASGRERGGQPLESAAATAGQAMVDGDRVRLPLSYREWVFVGAALGLSYSESGAPVAAGEHDAPGQFTHVYLDPDSFAHFRDTGEFREGATFVLDMHRPRGGVSIARDGWFEGERTAIHAAVMDRQRFGGWGYFNVGADGNGRRIASASCSSCHVEHGAMDGAFVQFYPLLRELPVAAAAREALSGMR